MEATTTNKAADYEVIIVGGSYAGLSAAMALGRSLRRVLIIDGGLPCNRQTPHSHNFITKDGVKPSDIANQAREQVLAYATVQWLKGVVTNAQKAERGFSVETAAGERFTALKILFATGITDILPDLPGFSDCWGISVLHCPYCHGYEVNGKRLAIVANGDLAFEYVRLIHQWSKQLVLFTNGPSTLVEAHRQKFAEHGIDIIETTIANVVHKGGYLNSVQLTDGSSIAVDAVFYKPAFRQHCPLPAALGCMLTEQGFIQADDFGKTSVSGIFVAGDNANMMRSVAAAVAAGNKAGAWVNRELVEEQF